MMRRGALLLAAAMVVVSCGGETTPLAAPEPETGPAPAHAAPPLDEIPPPPVDSRPVYRGFEAGLSDHDALAAMVIGDTEVFSAPDEGAPLLTMPWTTILGTVTVLSVIDGPVDGWAEVLLPIRPNGSTGWVKTEDVELYVVEGNIVVDLSERQLTYYLNGEEVVSTTVAIGTSRNPTPTGSFFVTDNVTLANPNSPWGPHALGLSARSEVITEFNGGDGIIGIHGTNRPSTIGTAASLGCVRLPNDIITMLHHMVPIGTPVEIRA